MVVGSRGVTGTEWKPPIGSIDEAPSPGCEVEHGAAAEPLAVGLISAVFHEGSVPCHGDGVGVEEELGDVGFENGSLVWFPCLRTDQRAATRHIDHPFRDVNTCRSRHRWSCSPIFGLDGRWRPLPAAFTRE